MEDKEKSSYWRKLIALQESTGLSGPRFCQENNLVYHQFTYWVRKFRDESKDESGSFLPVKLKQSGSIQIEHGKFSIAVDRDFDELTLKRILACMQ